jgi:hypothetical protein
MSNKCIEMPEFLRAALEEREKFVKLEVLHLEDDLRTRVAIGPAKLETLGIACKTVDDPQTLEAIVNSVAATAMCENPGRLDARWGLIFTNAEGRRVLSLYLDKFGRRAAVDGHEVILRDGEPLIDRLKSLGAGSPAAIAP